MASEIPIACTLSPSDYRSRLAEIAALSRDALRRVERRGLTLDLRYAPEAASRVRRLMEQERSCCAFLHLGGRVKTGHFADSQNRPFLAGVETA